MNIQRIILTNGDPFRNTTAVLWHGVGKSQVGWDAGRGKRQPTHPGRARLIENKDLIGRNQPIQPFDDREPGAAEIPRVIREQRGKRIGGDPATCEMPGAGGDDQADNHRS